MKILISFFILIIIAAMVITYDKISQPDFPVVKKEMNFSWETKKEGFKLSFKTFNFPARELFIKIDFREYKNVILYKIVIKANDKFALFNIKSILENENIPYSLIENKEVEVFILFKSLSQADRIIKLFKSYRFNVEIEKIVKRI